MVMPARKRRRAVHSCTECHRRKQKCDRGHPCDNCTRREKQGLCYYNSSPEASRTDQSTSTHAVLSDIYNTANRAHLNSPADADLEHVTHDTRDRLRGFGYASQDRYNSMSLLEATERHLSLTTSSSSVESPLTGKSGFPLQHDARRRCLDIIRRLPSQVSADALIRTYFTFTNWQYDLLDEDVFRAQLQEWRTLSYSDHKEGLAEIAAELLGFPALLLQVLAQALLIHPPHDQRVSGLLVIAGMTLHDLGREYSEAGTELLHLVGKGAITTATVRASLLRASFLKSSGEVIDAWHTLGATIRDAQEIGLHIEQGEHQEEFGATEVTSQAPNADGKKVWMILHIWDAHMAVVLGRPMATRLRLEGFSQSLGDLERRRALFEHWRTENELPRPFDVIIAGYNVAYRFFQDIHDLENRESNPQSDITIEWIHTTIMGNLASLPSWLRLENPDLRFDMVDGLHWLGPAREMLCSLVHLVLLALHRPYIFTKPDSRVEALKAGLHILCAQERLFQGSAPHQHTLFTPVYASFDAIVLIAAIYLAFPTQNCERQPECLQAVERAIERLDVIGRSNHMARSAHAVAWSLYRRLKHRLGSIQAADRTKETVSCSGEAPFDYHSHSSGLALTEPLLCAISPPRPVHDLFYSDLSSAQEPLSQDLSDKLTADRATEDSADIWDFQGIFSDTSFWSVMNEFQPGT